MSTPIREPDTTTRWVTVASGMAVREGEVASVVFEGEEVALYRIGGLVYATHNICTHEFAGLADGYLEGYEIECPLHQGRFDVRSGLPTREPCEVALRIYRVREIGAEVQLALGMY